MFNFRFDSTQTSLNGFLRNLVFQMFHFNTSPSMKSFKEPMKKIMQHNKAFLLVVFPLLVIGFQNCGPALESTGVSNNTLSAQSFDGVFQSVIAARCTQCHSGPGASAGIDLSSYDAIIGSGTVVPGNSQASTLFLEVSSGQMPPNQPLSSGDVAKIAEWIDNGAQDQGGSAANEVPVVNAGDDVTQTMPVTSVTFNSTSHDGDGTIQSLYWSQVSGPNLASLSGAQTPALTVSNLVAGTYTFSLEATDNLGAVSSDTVVLTINPQPNVAPMANAGADQSITSPANTATLTGTASDSDGTVASTVWSQVSGPVTATIQSPTNLSTMVSGLTQEGTYDFQLLVTDDSGDSTTDTVKVVVSPPDNVLPVANAGADQTITLPTAMITINGSATDADGTIAAYAWSQLTGPSAATLTGVATANLTASNLVEGQYQFELTVTDDDGGLGSDQVVVTVEAAPAPPTFTELNQTIFGPRCIACHSGGNPSGNYGMDDYNLVVSEVVAGDADSSDLYLRVLDDSMPRGQAPLSAAEKTKIKDWINAGALNN